MTVKLKGVCEFIQGHTRSYASGLPSTVRSRHEQRIRVWAGSLAAWATEHRTPMVISPAPLGDPHAPDGVRAAQLLIGPARRKFIWKPGVERFRIELACQKVIELLGPTSGLMPISGFEIAGGGAWSRVKLAAKQSANEATVGRAFAHLLLLAAAVGLPDMHYENIAWDGTAFRLLDTETFAGPTRAASDPALPASRRLRMAERIGHSGFIFTLLAKYPSEGLTRHILTHLDDALARVQANWPEIRALREDISGLHARVLLVPSQQMSDLMPYAVSPEWRSRAWTEFTTHMPDTFDHEAAFADLVNGCIPIHRRAIPTVDDPADGVIEPDSTMTGLIRAVLRAIELHGQADQPGLEEILRSVRLVDEAAPAEPAEFYALPANGNEADILWDHPGFCFGLGGLAYLHAAEASSGRPHQVPSSAEVFDTQARRTQAARPMAGAFLGLGGEFMLGWGLDRLGALSPALRSALDDRLGYFPTSKGPVLDLGLGLAGSLVGLARAGEVFPHRRGDLKTWGQALTDLIQGEVSELLADPDRRNRAHLGFAHGLAGTTFSLLAARASLGVEVQVLDDLLTLLREHIARQVGDPRGPFCQSWAGPMAVLLAAAGGEEWHPTPPALLGGATNGCCGTAAYHLARLAPVSTDLIPAPACQGNAPFGYLGTAGLLTIRLAAFGKIPDPLWGRELLPPRP